LWVAGGGSVARDEGVLGVHGAGGIC
jgi:hypothetical protein